MVILVCHVIFQELVAVGTCEFMNRNHKSLEAIGPLKG